MGSPKESLVKKNIFTEKYDEIRRLDGNHYQNPFSGIPVLICVHEHPRAGHHQDAGLIST
jgi:hypothetical protein